MHLHYNVCKRLHINRAQNRYSFFTNVVLKMIKKIRNIPLKQKLLAIMLAGLSIMAVMSFVIIQILSSSYNRMLYRSMAESLSYSAKEIVEYMEKMDNITQLFMSDNVIQRGMEELKEKQKNGEMYYNTLHNLGVNVSNYYYNYYDNILKNISLYTNVSTIKTNLIAADNVPQNIQEEVLEKSEKAEGAVCWVDDYMDEYGLFLAREIRQIEGLKLDTLGTIMINIDMNSLVESSTKFEEQYGETEYLIASGQNVLYHTENLPAEQMEMKRLDEISQYGILDIDGNNWFITHGTISEYGWDYYCFVSYEEISREIVRIQSICLWIIILDFAFAICLTIGLIRSLMVHISDLKDRMQVFAGDNTKVPAARYDYTDRGDELGTLNRQFDEMSQTIINLIQENYVSELLKKEAQLKALENQINPHFLYNTLDSIKWRAKAIGEKDIPDMVEALGILLRTSLSSKKDKDYTVGDEMEIVSSYITIQKVRYEERLCFENDVAWEWYSYRIPKLIIQPLIENAIFYGLEVNVDECYIILNAKKDKDGLRFFVKNTGSEMEEDLLDKLKNEEIKPHGHGVGLINIDSRLRMQYGEDYGLRLYNEKEFAVAELVIPVEEENDAETDHSR